MTTEQGLRTLWKEAFGDTDAFLDGFFREGYAPERCAATVLDGKPVCALYWFDCFWDCRKLAYIYGVATAKSHRGQGLCRDLMERTHQRLRQQGYSGAVLVPAEPGVATLYQKLGYRHFGGMKHLKISAGSTAAQLEELDPKTYDLLRQRHLPPDGICQPGATLSFLGTYARFFRGDEILFAAAQEGETLFFQEFFGDPDCVPGILLTFGAQTGHLRIPDGKTPFAMFLPFTDESAIPSYLGIPLD